MFVKRRQYPLAAIGVEAVKVGVSVLGRRADRSSELVVYVFKSGDAGDGAAAYQSGADVLNSTCLAEDIRQERGTSDESLMSLSTSPDSPNSSSARTFSDCFASVRSARVMGLRSNFASLRRLVAFVE